MKQLRRELEASVRNRQEMELEKAKENKKDQLNRMYEEKIRTKIDEKNSEAREELAGLTAMVEKHRLKGKGRPRVLTPEEEEEFILQTIDEISSNPSML